MAPANIEDTMNISRISMNYLHYDQVQRIPEVKALTAHGWVVIKQQPWNMCIVDPSLGGVRVRDTTYKGCWIGDALP